jgi:hypothetical protein
MALEESFNGFRNRLLRCCPSRRRCHRIRSAFDVPFKLGVSGHAARREGHRRGRGNCIYPVGLLDRPPEIRAGFEVSPERVDLATSVRVCDITSGLNRKVLQ